MPPIKKTPRTCGPRTGVDSVKKDGILGGLIIITTRNPVEVLFFSYSFVKIWNPA